jgi:hypothetical protein
MIDILEGEEEQASRLIDERDDQLFMYKHKMSYWKNMYKGQLDENMKLMVYRDAIHEMCSVRYAEIDDYIRVAKQAVSDYEDK